MCPPLLPSCPGRDNVNVLASLEEMKTKLTVRVHHHHHCHLLTANQRRLMLVTRWHICPRQLVNQVLCRLHLVKLTDPAKAASQLCLPAQIPYVSFVYVAVRDQ